jgi:hypothetical protein
MLTERLLLEETVERLRELTVQVNRMDAELAQHRLLLGEQPRWADAIMEAVGKIEASRVLQSRVEALDAEVIELRHWQITHSDGCGHAECPRKAASV